MKESLPRAIPLLLCIALGTVVSWFSIYAFWFAVWTFHNIEAARAADALGNTLLFPARWVFEYLGGDQSTIFYDPVAFSGTNGLIVGVLLYCVYRAFPRSRAALPQGDSRPATRAGSSPSDSAKSRLIAR